MILLEGIQKSFREPNGSERLLFEDLMFSLSSDVGSVAILGRSGSGKTTMLRIIAGLDITYSGSYTFCGKALEKKSSAMAAYRMKNIGFITQSYDLLFDRNVANNIALGMPWRSERCARVAECLELVGLAGFEKKTVRSLSGGEAQRVAIARALAKNPSIVLADEPSGALDEATEAGILDLFDNLKGKGIKFIIATHNKTVANRCDIQMIIQGKTLHTAAGAFR